MRMPPDRPSTGVQNSDCYDGVKARFHLHEEGEPHERGAGPHVDARPTSQTNKKDAFYG
jgi:hypothetical protein